MSLSEIIKHYDILIDENNDPVHDPKSLRDYMDKWDGQSFIDRLQLDNTKDVLEIGVGTGRLAVRIAPLCGEFTGIDLSPKTVARAKANLFGLHNAQIFCGDFLTYSFSKKFDVIYSSLTFMHIKEKQKAVHKVSALLKEGGRFVLSIDKNKDKYINTGTSKLAVFPDNPINMKSYIENAGLIVSELYETEFAYIFVSCKIS